MKFMRLQIRWLFFVVFASVSLCGDLARASVFDFREGRFTALELEGQILWQGRNDARIPGDTGSRFSLRDVISTPVGGLRVEPTYVISERHQLRGVFAPLTLEGTDRLTQSVRFQKTDFNAAIPVDASFKFNSYRLTYRYRFFDNKKWLVYGGLTAKVRDAHIKIRQGNSFEESTNVGFVPLLHAAASYRFLPELSAEFEADALAAPQGRAEDLRIGLRWNIVPSGFSALLGYRLLEGGADNSKVFTFALFHYGTLAVAYSI